MNLSDLKSIFLNNGCKKIYAKHLALNDNSKNQVYFGSSFDILNILPIKEITTVEVGDWTKERFKASINFAWIGDDGNLYPAPRAQLILYPKYPEVRFSGFLMKCSNPPSSIMSKRLEGRILFFSVSNSGMVLGFVVDSENIIVREFEQIDSISTHGVFQVIELPEITNNRERLIKEMLRVHQLGWIKSKRLNREGNIIPCESSNCGGYTLEAELGIIPNGYSEPDFLGWEIKQFGVKSFHNINSSVITLMTPEPTGGLYKNEGVEFFIRKYGYLDKKGRADRMNFGGIHKIGLKHKTTDLEMRLIGFDHESGKIRNSNGKIGLFDSNDNETASWSFASMLLHWNRKHNQACYVPSLLENKNSRYYKYGNNLILGVGTDFHLFLQQMAIGNIYYDPGIKLEHMSTSPKTKRRSQFRIKSKFLGNLYNSNQIYDLAQSTE